jgi:TonB-linked SusC/RagA family outer membrane protein
LSVVFGFFAATGLAAQNTGTVAGQVTDATTGEPITGAQVQVAGTNLGGLTGENGRYLITRVPTGEQTIRVILIGYARQAETVNVTPGGTATANFELEASAVELEGVVVSAATGREQRMRELGTQVASIELEDVNPAPVTSFAEALGGRSSGVVMQDVGGTTGTAQRIRIRGANSLNLSNEPLIFLDGIRIETGTAGFGVGGQEPSRLNDLNPGDIANIEVVKGPAASAMYGTAAANGVILITTKRGTPGATQWSAFAETGVVEDKNDYPNNWGAIDILDDTEPLFIEDGTFAGFLNPAAASFCPNFSAAAGACEQDDVIEYNTLMEDPTRPFDPGARQRYGVSARGGTETVRYFVSGQYEDQTGVISFNTQEKLNFRANLDADLAETVDLAVSFGYASTSLALNSNDNSIFSPLINGLLGYPNLIPEDTARGIQGSPVNNFNYGFGFNMRELSELPAQQDVDRYTTSTNLRWRPTSWLTINGQAGIDLTSTHDFETLQPEVLPIARVYRLGYRQSRRAHDYLLTGIASGVATFELTTDLTSTTTFGTQYTRDNRETTYCFGSSLVPGTASCGTTASDFSIDESFFEVRTIGGYVQQELAWRDRVFLAGGLRADDNSAFGQEFELAYYPSASLSWVVAEEPWFPQSDIMSELRLRAAYGVSGLRPGFRQAVTLFSPTTVAQAAGDVPGVSLSVTGNPQLKPERSREYEFGFDAGLFRDRVSVEFTYFDKKSEDALISRRLPGSLGLTASTLDNLGSVQNTGTELTVNLTVLETDAVGWNVGFTNSTLDNEVLELGKDIEPIIFNRGLQRHAEGYSAGGFFQVPYEYEDANGDGLLEISEVNFVRYEDGDDIPEGYAVGDVVKEEYIGPSLPTWQRTIFTDLRLGDIVTVSALFEGRGGYYQGNDSEAFRCGVASSFRYGCSAVGNPDASLDEQARFIADRFLGTAYGFVEEANFYRWREVSIALTPPAALVERFQQLQGLQLTLAGRNLATWTDYTGLDPETNETGGNSNFSQSEFNTQPPVRTLMIRLDYSF